MNTAERNQTETDIRKILKDLGKTPGFQRAHRKERTLLIKKAFAELKPRGKKWTPYYTGRSKESEWVFDFSALELDGGWLRRAPFVVESELGSESEVQNDFQRLLIARADLRVMIFQTLEIENYRVLLDDLKKAVDLFELSQIGDRYLIAYYLEDKKCFDFKSFCVERTTRAD